MIKAYLKKAAQFVSIKHICLLLFSLWFLSAYAAGDINPYPSTEPRPQGSVTGDGNSSSVSRQSNNANPYQGEAPVASYAPADWQKAVSPALKQVLIKVSGNANIAQIPVVQKALKKPNSFVQSYNYLEAPANKSLMLQVRFSQKAINTLLQEANQPVSASVATPSADYMPAGEAIDNSQASEFSEPAPVTQSEQTTAPTAMNETAAPSSPQQSSQPVPRAQPSASNLHAGGWAPIVEGVPVVALDSNNNVSTGSSMQSVEQAESFAAPAQDEQFVSEGGGVSP